MDSYTLRGFDWKAFDYLDYAAKVGLDVIQFSEWPHLGSYEDVKDDGYLRRVREHAEKVGVRIEAGTWGVCPTNPGSQRNFQRYGPPADQLRFAIHWAEILGAKTVRCVMGSGDLRREHGPIEKHVEAMIGVLKQVRDDALRAGVKIAPENHKDLRATEMRALIEEAGTDFVGCTLDTGNPMEVLEDPLETVEVLGPLAVASHFRDSVLWEHPRGAAFQWTALGDGSVEIEKAVKRYTEVAPGAPIILEIITGRPPAVLPYWENDFWQAFPNLKAEEFARFAKLVKKGHPLMAGMMIPNNDADNPVFEKAVVEQQRVDFERSLSWLRARI
jgi:sugar phosphate isomerase/epimerase